MAKLLEPSHCDTAVLFTMQWKW